jgi:hypothetical protein
MAGLRKSYFLAPSWEISPSEVVLGGVIANFKRPQQSLSASELPENIDTPIYEPPEEPSSGTAKDSRQWSAGLFAKFMQFIPIGGEVSHASSSTLEIEYSCESMKTRRFTPSRTYIAKAAANEEVDSHLKMGGRGTKVFLITGTKTATNITITTTEEVESENVAQIGVDIPAIQLTIGPKGSRKHTKLLKHTRVIAGPILFAFEIEKIRLNRKREVESSEYIEGAMLGQKSGAIDDFVIERAGSELDNEEIDDFEVVVVSGHDESGDEYDIVVSEA